MNQFLWAAVPLLIGVLLSWFMARAYYRKGGLAYYVKDFDLIDLDRFNLGKKISISADGNDVRELRVATVAVWNSGTVGYSKNDIAEKDPLRLVRPKAGFAQVLGHTQSRHAVSPEFQQSGEVIHVRFDLLDESDWIVFRVVYEGDSKPDKERQKPQVAGSLLNLPSGIKYVDLEDYFTEKLWLRRFSALLIMLLPLAVVYTFYNVLLLTAEMEKATGKSMPGSDVFFWVGLFFVAVVVLSAVLFQISRWMLVSTRVPKAILKVLK